MFAIKGKISSIEKRNYKKGVFYVILLCRSSTNEQFKDTFIEFLCFNEKAIETIQSNELEQNDVVEMTFYIKGDFSKERNVGWRNILFATNVIVIKKAVKKETKII